MVQMLLALIAFFTMDLYYAGSRSHMVFGVIDEYFVQYESLYSIDIQQYCIIHFLKIVLSVSIIFVYYFLTLDIIIKQFYRNGKEKLPEVT